MASGVIKLTRNISAAGTNDRVKASATDPVPNYLDAKVDNVTIEVSSDKLQIKEGGVDSTEIAALAVTEDKITAGAVTNLKINADSDALDNVSGVSGATVTAALDNLETVSDNHIADLANPHQVTPAQIAAGTDDITNDSTITGTTATDALNNLQILGETGGATISISSDYTITDDDGAGFVIATAGATPRTVTMPTLADNTGRIITIKKLDAGLGSVTVTGEGVETINGQTNFYLGEAGATVKLRANGDDWVVLNKDFYFFSAHYIDGAEEDAVFFGPHAGESWTPGSGMNDLCFFGSNAGRYNLGNSVVAIGEDCGENNTGDDCVLAGEDAGRNNDGNSATLLGRDAGWDNSGNFIVGVGRQTGRNNTGTYVTAIQALACSNNTGSNTIGIGRTAANWIDGDHNIYIGMYAGQNLTGAHQTGDRVVGIGKQTAQFLIASDCVCLGAFAGQNNTEDNRLFIHSSASDVGEDALITGHFTEKWVKINDDLIVMGEIQSLANAPIILNANGTGAIQIDSGGNARGEHAIDLQKVRTLDTQVASGRYSFIAGGQLNRATATCSHAEGFNTLAQASAAHAEGLNTVASGANSHAEGQNTGASGSSAHSEGIFTSAPGNSSHAGGFHSKASRSGEFARASNWINYSGDSQYMINAQRKITSDAAQTELTIDGAAPSTSNRLILPAKTTWTFAVSVAAYNTDDNLGAGWQFKGVIKRDALSNTIMIGTLGEDSWEEGTMSACNVTVEADDTNDSLVVLVTGLAGKNIRWHAKIDTNQMTYGTG